MMPKSALPVGKKPLNCSTAKGKHRKGVVDARLEKVIETLNYFKSNALALW